MATANAVTKIRTTKRGLDLTSFEDLTIYKEVPVVAEVANVEDALARLNGDNSKLLSIIRDGLQQEAVSEARKSADGWKLIDEDGKPTETAFAGSLANSEDVNPVVLMFAKLNFGYDDAKNADEKRAAKQAAKDMIKQMPPVLEGLRKKAEASSAKGDSETTQTPTAQ